jgi:hypothetical protein
LLNCRTKSMRQTFCMSQPLALYHNNPHNYEPNN